MPLLGVATSTKLPALSVTGVVLEPEPVVCPLAIVQVNEGEAFALFTRRVNTIDVLGAV